MINQSSKLLEARQILAAIAAESDRDAYAAGYNHAHGIACHNVPTIGDVIPGYMDDYGFGSVDSDNVADVHAMLCHAAESNARCFTPWEHTAAGINALDEGDAESAWEHYEQGVADAIAHDLDGYTYEESES